MAIENLDGEDQTLIFKTVKYPQTGPKIETYFGTSKERALQSKVLSDMLNLDELQQPMNEANAVKLSEDADQIRIFLNSLLQSKWKQIKLRPAQVLSQLQIADKYEAVNASLYIACIVHIPDVYKWDFNQVMCIYHYSTLFNLSALRIKALKRFVLLGDLSNHSIADPSTRIASHHLHDLFIFRQAWMNLSFMKFDFTVNCANKGVCEAVWKKHLKPDLFLGKRPPLMDSSKLCLGHQLLCNEAVFRMSSEFENVAFDHLECE